MRYAIIYAFICRPLPVNIVLQYVILQANDFFLNLGSKETIQSFLLVFLIARYFQENGRVAGPAVFCRNQAKLSHYFLKYLKEQ